MDRANWNLLVLSGADGESLSPVQLQKCLFLLGKAFPDEISGEGFYDFQPYNYGVFDADVYSDAERMQKKGLTRIAPTGGGWKEYAATPEGLAAAGEVRMQIPANVADYIPRLVSWARSLSFADLVRAVYERFPETREKSIFKG